jgi:E3 ubiquitin-protein ligase HUWE1
MAEEQAFLDLIFPEKVDFRSLFDTYFDMFKMDLGGEFHFIIIQVLSSLMRTETFSEDDECFSCLRSHDEQIMKMVQDVLSNGESQVLPLATAKHPRFAMQLLSFCASEIGILVLSRNTVISGIVGSVLKYLRELVPTSNPDTTKECISLIGRLSRRDEFQREYNLLDEILTLTNAILLTPEIDSFDALAALYIQQLNELFREEGGRRANRANAPTIARKIAETSLMKHLKILP